MDAKSYSFLFVCVIISNIVSGYAELTWKPVGSAPKEESPWLGNIYSYLYDRIVTDFSVNFINTWYAYSLQTQSR